MRYFTLLKGDAQDEEHATSDQKLDITNTQMLFHDISGLGFEEENQFRQLGDVWWLDRSSTRQQPVSGTMCFTEFGDTDPYTKYQSFAHFIENEVLRLVYKPHGSTGRSFYRRVRVGKLEKTEITKYGALECAIEFVPYTPWYEYASVENHIDDSGFETGWVWGGNGADPLVFEAYTIDPETGDKIWHEGVTPPATLTKFRNEVRQSVTINLNSAKKPSPTRLTIYGPAVNPSWTHYVNNDLVEAGGFADAFTLGENERLIIDCTDGIYSMQVVDDTTGIVRDIYSLRDFGKECFVFLRSGENAINVSNTDNSSVHIKVEGHIYYATV